MDIIPAAHYKFLQKFSAYQALKIYLLTNSCLIEDMPLFAFENLDGGWNPMWRNWFLT